MSTRIAQPRRVPAAHSAARSREGASSPLTASLIAGLVCAMAWLSTGCGLLVDVDFAPDGGVAD